MIFLASSGKMTFLFPKNIILFFWRKWKMIFLKKYMEIWYFLQMFWKYNISKKIALHYDLSCIIRKDGISLSQKYGIFGGNWKTVFLKKYMEIWYYLFLQIWNYPSVRKSKMIFSQKMHLKTTFSASLEKMMLILDKIILTF